MVYLLPTDEQNELLDQVSGFLSAEFPLSRLRERKGRDELSQWDSLVAFGLTGLGASADIGGSGMAFSEEALIFARLGRALISPSILATSVASRLAAANGDAGTAAALVGGQKRACLAIASDEGDGVYLVDSDGADLVLKAAPGALSLYVADAFELVSVASLDDGVSLHAADRANAAPLAEVAGDDPLIADYTCLCAAMLTGIAETARDLAADFAKEREQFGRPIGAFQAIKHRCADMAIHTELALAQLYRAAVTCSGDGADAQFHAAAALRLAAVAALENAAAAIQVHGGIGFTAECDVHWLLKRAHLLKAASATLLAEPEPFLRASPVAAELERA